MFHTNDRLIFCFDRNESEYTCNNAKKNKKKEHKEKKRKKKLC